MTWRAQGKLDGTIWACPPHDVIAAASVLIDDEKEFARLFIQKPEDAKKKKKKGGEEVGGVIQLVDAKRAMNAGIALAKLRVRHGNGWTCVHRRDPAATLHVLSAQVSFGIVADCLMNMSSRSGKLLLTMVEIQVREAGTSARHQRVRAHPCIHALAQRATRMQNLVALCPTDEEVNLVKSFKGDTSRLGQAEKFFLAVADVPAARQRAEGLSFQATFDERIREASARIKLFAAAVEQIRSASRLQQLMKAVAVLGNKMNGVSKKSKAGVVRAYTVASLQQLHLVRLSAWRVQPVRSDTILQHSVCEHRCRQKRSTSRPPFSSTSSNCSARRSRAYCSCQRCAHCVTCGRRGKGVCAPARPARFVMQDFAGETLMEAKRLPLDVMNEEMKELRESLTALEALIRDAAQEASGWAGLNTGADGPMYVDEDVETATDSKERSKSKAKDAVHTSSDATPIEGGAPAASPQAAGKESDPPTPEGAPARARVPPLRSEAVCHTRARTLAWR